MLILVILIALASAGLLLLAALRHYQAQQKANKPWADRPAGSVAPLY